MGASQYADTVDQLRLYVSTDLDARDDTKKLVLEALENNKALEVPDINSVAEPQGTGNEFKNKILIQQYFEDKKDKLKEIEDAKKAKRVVLGSCSDSAQRAYETSSNKPKNIKRPMWIKILLHFSRRFKNTRRLSNLYRTGTYRWLQALDRSTLSGKMADQILII